MDFQLKGHNALVCASSRGLGLATAMALAREGVQVFLTARNAEALAAAAAEIRGHTGVKVEYAAMYLNSPDAPRRLAKLAQDRLGRIDILVNNIGGPPPTKATDTTAAQWRAGFEQVFLTAVELTNALLPAMRAAHFGRIITITSLSVLEPIENLVISTAMRLAITGFTKTLATEVAQDGVTVNTILPGVIHTDRIEDLRRAKAERSGTTLAEEMQKTEQLIPAGRLGRPDELAAFVAFLASKQAGYITGTHTPIDGGMRRGW